ncbi:MAG: hypothetical protein M0003_10000 [Acidithiobacillus sp.]|jgi:hypothetical protein|nr:hypothetical protein [Acidithiobacillus sp.]
MLPYGCHELHAYFWALYGNAQKKASVAKWLLMLVVMVRELPMAKAVVVLIPVNYLNDVVVLLSAARRVLALRFSLLAFPHENDKTCHYGGAAHEDGKCP